MTTLTEAGYSLTLPETATAGEPFSVELKSTDRAFLGYLVRVEGGGDVELTSEEATMAEACAVVPGLTHGSAEPRMSVMFEVEPMEMGTLVIDVTVVEANNATASIYSYEAFSLEVADAASASWVASMTTAFGLSALAFALL